MEGISQEAIALAGHLKLNKLILFWDNNNISIDGPVSLADNAWYYSSQPTLGTRLAGRVGARALDLTRATTLAWQSSGTDRNGNDVRFTIEQIDPQTTIIGAGVSGPETLLWLTLYPLGIGGQRDPTTGAYRWKVENPLPGVRWRSKQYQQIARHSDVSANQAKIHK